MSRVSSPARKRAWAAIAALSSAVTLLPSPAVGQIEIRAEERKAEIDRIEPEAVPLRRHVLPRQQLALWLPEGWREVAQVDSAVASFSVDGGRQTLHVGRNPTEPGTGLIQIMEASVDQMRGADLLKEVESVRRVRVASRDAFEIAGSTLLKGAEAASRLLVSMDPDRDHYRLILMQGEERSGEALDAALKRLLRDWTPLDGTAWTTSFERLRRSQIDDEPAMVWAERNRLFDAMVRPAAIGQPWVEKRLRDVARQDPLLLLDGAFHHHPRVRIGCLEALQPTLLAEPLRTGFYATVVLDAEPAVRFRLARRIVSEPSLAAALLDRVLAIDSEAARAAAFQVLAAAAGSLREQLVVAAFTERAHYPESTQSLLATVLAEWGPRSEAEALLHTAWKRSKSESVQRAALLELLELGNGEALAAARRRLQQPLLEDSPSLSAAATSAAVQADANDGAEPWRRLAASLEEARSNGAASSEVERDIQAGRETLEELVSYLESLPGGASAEDECAALGRLLRGGGWVGRRFLELQCSMAKPPTPLARASLPRPGAYAFSLLDFLDRLEVGSTPQNQAFHAVLDRLDSVLGDWAGDPINTSSTGIDLEAPWDLAWWGAKSETSVPRWGGVSIRLASSDPDRLLDTLLRAFANNLDLESLSNAVLFSNALALLPAGLVTVWSDEQERVTGTDTSSSTPSRPERYLALGAVDRRQEHLHRALYQLEIDSEEGAEWRHIHFFQKGEEVTLSDAAVLDLAAGAEDRSSPAATPSARVEADIAAALERLLPDDLDEELRRLIDLGFSVSASTALEADSIVTSLEMDGLPEEWLSLARNLASSRLRAPHELLPESCFLWVGLSLDPAALLELLRQGAFELLDDARPRARQRTLELAQHFRGEAGLAMVSAPDPRSEGAAKAWASRLVAYLSVEPEAADRFFRKLTRKREIYAGRRLFRLGDVVVSRIGEFLVFAENAQTLATLGRPPYLSASPMYQQVETRAPPEAMLWAGWDSDRLADAITASIRGRRGEEESTFVIEIFRSFGNIVGWLRRGETALAGELATNPRLQSEVTQAWVRRLTGFADLTWGSIGARGLPNRAIGTGAQTAVELTLRLPRDLPGLQLAWTNERLDQEVVEPGLYRFVSRAAEPLPEDSGLTLPITGPDLLPYVRDEHNLNLYSDEIRSLADTIRGGETDPARIVRAIVDWAHEGLEYSVVEGTESVERILATRQADCTEFTQLTIALARSLGIPARAVQGTFVGRNAAYLHRWAEVYLDRWYEIDPTWGVVQIPPTNLRIPLDDSRFLASLPGARFVVEAVHGPDGRWARRLPAGTPAAGSASIAVDGERILLAYPVRAGQSEPAPRVLYSGDGGQSFVEIPAPQPDDMALRMLGGHGSLLWIQRDRGSETSRNRLYELQPTGQWQQLRLPDELARSGDWTLGVHPRGYLALVDRPSSSRLLLLDPSLALIRAVPLPERAEGEWVLARSQGLLARTVEGEGISLHQWTDDRWEAAVEIADSAELAAISLRRSGDRIEVTSRHRSSGQLFLLRVEGDSQTRRSLSSKETAALDDATLTAAEEWTAWVDRRDQLLLRRPAGEETATTVVHHR